MAATKRPATRLSPMTETPEAEFAMGSLAPAAFVPFTVPLTKPPAALMATGLILGTIVAVDRSVVALRAPARTVADAL